MQHIFQPGWDLTGALRAASTALGGPDRTLAVPDLEVAVLARSNGRRAFRRIEDEVTARLLGQPANAAPTLERGPDMPAEGREAGDGNGSP